MEFNSFDIYSAHTEFCAQLTRHSDMTCSELPSWRPLETSEADKVILIVCGGSKKYDKNNSDLFARDIHLKPQNLSYLNSCVVLVVLF